MKNSKLIGGTVLMAGFLAILGLVFSPVIKGQNVLEYLDSLYNSISKASAYYIPAVQKDVEKAGQIGVSASLKMSSDKEAAQTAELFSAGGAQVKVEGSNLKVTGDLGKILANALSDADAMYHNQGDKLVKKYNYNENLALYNWWRGLKAMEKDLAKQKQFKSAKLISHVQGKAIEPSYNYYKIEPLPIGSAWGIVVLSLVFYVIYTLWYGFAVLYLFEGFGLRLGH